MEHKQDTKRKASQPGSRYRGIGKADRPASREFVTVLPTWVHRGLKLPHVRILSGSV